MTYKIDKFFDDNYMKNLHKKSAIELIQKTLKINMGNSKLYKIQRVLYLKNLLTKKLIDFNGNEEAIFIEISKWYYRVINQNSPLWLEEKINSYYKRNPSYLRVYDLNDFQNKKWTIDDVVRDSVLLSGSQITNYVPSEVDIKYWTSLRKKNQELFLGIVFCGQLVGHVGAVALSSKEYKLMKKGILSEDDLKEGLLDRDRIEFLYIPTIVILPQYRSPFFLKSFLKSFFLCLKKINKKKYLKSILVNIYTKNGELLSKKLGFKFVTKHKDGGDIYNYDFSEISNQNSFVNKLLEG